MSAVQPIVLLVEDDGNDILLFQHACRSANVSFKLAPVDDAERALDYLNGAGEFADRFANPFPALVLLDLKMPRMAGFELLSAIRANPAFKQLPIITFTASKNLDDVNRVYEMGGNSYLLKPVKFDELIEMARVIDNYWLAWNKHPGN